MIVPPVLLDEPARGIAAGAVALRALDHDDGELADEVAERGSGGGGQTRTEAAN